MSLIDLYISDCGSVRRIGDNCHDMLTIEDGKLCYLNLQNGEGCRLGEDGEWYRFVDNVDEYGYNCDPRKTESDSENPNNCEWSVEYAKEMLNTMPCEECGHWEHGAGDHYYCALLEMRQECCFESKGESTLMFANIPQTERSE